MKEVDKKKIKILLDCNALAHAAFWALPQSIELEEDDARVIYGFLNSVRKLAIEFKTDQFYFCWDSAKSYRRMIYPEYKANRLASLNDLQKENLRIAKKQFRELEKETLPQMGFRRIYSQNGYEADDIIAFWAIRKPDNYLIISGDADLYQLLYETDYVRCRIYRMNKKKIFTLSDLNLGTGLTKGDDWVLVKAMAGCSTDNIAGIEGVGEVKAIQYILNTLPEGKIKRRIEESQDIIQRNLNLVHLPYLGVIPLDIADEYPEDDELYAGEFMEMFRNYGFRSFLGDGFEKWREGFNLLPGSR